jgi:KaiC/GvpD/RAD55 family RecA-like ATPase
MMNYMLSSDNIQAVIRSRDDLRVCGNDGINYMIIKAAGQARVKFMRHIIKATIRYRRVIDSWKGARTILIYKKGDRDDPKNWRPITITNCVYRIYASLMARAFQEMNSRHRIYIDAQKSFIKKING